METIDLKMFRNTNKIQQKDLADYLETTRSFISLVETGKSKLPKSKLSKLLNNQEGWDVSMLRSGVDEMAPDSGSVTIDREAWDVIKSQQSTIEKQQDMLQQMIDMISKKGAQREDPAECAGAAGA